METIQNFVESVKETATTALHKTEDFLGIPHEMSEQEARRELETQARLEPSHDPDWHKSEKFETKPAAEEMPEAADPNSSVIIGSDPINEEFGIPPHMYYGESPHIERQADLSEESKPDRSDSRQWKSSEWDPTESDITQGAKKIAHGASGVVQEKADVYKESAKRGVERAEEALNIKHREHIEPARDNSDQYWDEMREGKDQLAKGISDAASDAKDYARQGLQKAEDALNIKRYDSPPADRSNWKDTRERVKDAKESVKDSAYNAKESVKQSAQEFKDAKPTSPLTRQQNKEEARESGKQMLHGAKEAVKDSAKSASDSTKQAFSDKRPFDEYTLSKGIHDAQYELHKNEAADSGKTFFQAAKEVAWDTAVGAKEAAMNVLGMNPPSDQSQSTPAP